MTKDDARDPSHAYVAEETSFVNLTADDALAGRWDFESFDCGDEHYNSWLRDHAAEQAHARTAGVHLLVSDRDEDRDRVLGYFALGLTVVQRDSLPKALHGAISAMSANYLLAKLGLHVDLRSRVAVTGSDVTWGKILVNEALRSCVQASKKLGGRLIVVDADNDGLVRYYENFGFKAMRDTDGKLIHLRLVMKTSTAAKALNID